MQFPVLDHAFLLQSLGWAIANSLWQTGGLWLLYQFITTIDKKLPALVKYHLSIVLLSLSFGWFLLTIQQNYRLLANASSPLEITFIDRWMFNMKAVNNVLPLLSIIYLAFLSWYMLRFCKHLSANRFLQMEGLTKSPIDFRLFVTKTAFHLGLKRKIQVWLSERVDVPSVTGFFKPVILLPAAIISHLSMQQIETILLHELAHIKRNDYLTNLFQAIVEMSLFFNPFAILLSKAAKKERENCCDDWVMNFQYDRHEYARALLILEEQRQVLQFRFALAATSGKKKLLHRVTRLFTTSPQTDFTYFQKIKFIGLCAGLFIIIFTTLPYTVIHQPANSETMFSNKKAKTNLVNMEELPKENPTTDIFIGQPLKTVKDKRQVATKTNTKKQLLIEPEKDYVNAFINEELLNPTPIFEAIPTPVVDKAIRSSTYLVIVEEQQSGKKQTNTYYFELNNNNGNPAIKPMIILNHFKMPPENKTQVRNLTDSLNTPTRPVSKKRITS